MSYIYIYIYIYNISTLRVNKLLVENLGFPHLVNKILAFYNMQMFIVVFSSSHLVIL